MPKAKKILAAHLVMPPTSKHPDPGVFWFASLDGEQWIGTTNDPRLGTPEELDRLMNPSKGSLPMRVTRDFLNSFGATFLTGEKHA